MYGRLEGINDAARAGAIKKYPVNTIEAKDMRDRAILQSIARRAMTERGSIPDFSPEALAGIRASTAPNCRYPDQITQRLLEAAIESDPRPYSNNELDALAETLHREEDAADKVERQVEESAAALFLESRINEQSYAIVTGASDKGTWGRLLDRPVEGRLVDGFEGLDIGNWVPVQLISINVERGFIDFKNGGPWRH
jgi:exoribonuclease R